jgi:hypothetical protein
MSNLIKRLETQPLADHRTIAILDEGGALPFPTSDDWLELADNGITVMTLASEVEVPMTVELWDAEPPPTTLPWSASGEGRVRFETGRIGINFLVEGDDTVEFEIARGIYHVRVHAAGRPDLVPPTTAAPRLAPRVEPEHYLVQIWPS